MRESLHPQARAVLEEIEAAGFQASGPATLAEMRRLQEIEPRFSGDPQPVKAIRDLVIDGPGGAVPVRVYTPDSPPPRPAVLFTHGGGWALGGIDFSDPLCRALCRASGMVIASIGYRLAPEHPFPAGLEDAYAALQWLEANAPSLGARPDAFAVCGDSAGGNLATALAIMSRDRGGPRVALQVMIYPALDPTLSLPSFDSCGTGYGLTRDDMRLFWDMYLQAPGDVTHPYASPLEAKSLGGLPPALILIA
ncbi:MAG TPA: alpha/beta hydrolase, partial [Candidatus Dormibacteraeota bacterium]|nr:alpha/beta hydrolase [Candidatus Dormibacteraeota bacterium]